MKLASLRIRLFLGSAVFIILALQITGLGLRVLFERSIARRTEAELSADLRQIRRGMVVDADGSLRIARAPTDPQFDIVHGGRYWQVMENGSTILRSSSLGSDNLDLPPKVEITEEDRRTWLLGPEKQHLFAIVRKHPVPDAAGDRGRSVIIITAVDGAEIVEDTNRFSSDLFDGLTGLALLLMLGALVHVTIGLQPLEKIRSSVALVRRGQSRRIEGQFPDEVMPLVTETNALLESQERTIAAARERAGDLAHGLKTPLAIMATKSRALRASGEHKMAEAIDHQIDIMQRHVERELARARARGASLAVLPNIDTSRLLRGLVSAIQDLPRDPVLEWSSAIPETLLLPVDRDDFNNMLGNLLENAHKWGKRKVHVTARSLESTAEFTIEDDGPGVPQDMHKTILRRGGRADTSVAGSGLGLAIVSDLVESYHGSLRLDASPLGGLRARLLLPRSDSID